MALEHWSILEIVDKDIPDLLEPEAGCVVLDRCVAIWDRDCNVVDDMVVYLGIKGDVNVDLLDVVVMGDEVDVDVLRKMRAGGN